MMEEDKPMSFLQSFLFYSDLFPPPPAPAQLRWAARYQHPGADTWRPTWALRNYESQKVNHTHTHFIAAFLNVRYMIL